MRTLLICSALLIVSVAFSRPCVKGQGEVVKKSLTVDAFHGIALEGSMYVVFTQGAPRSVEVEAQANLIELVETSVSKGIWTLGTRDGYSTNKPFIVHITVPVIDVVRLDGSGDITTNGVFSVGDMELAIAGSGNISIAFNSKKTNVSIDGSGDVTLSGTSDVLKVAIAGSGDVHAQALKASDATVDIAGSGDVTLDASQSLEASIAGSGDVSYKGAPARISRNVMGSGEVRSLDRGPR